jgi:hypothetical protein
MNQQDQDALEALIDRTNLSSVIDALASICDEKAAHLRENWQEYGGQERWWRVWGRKLRTTRDSVEAGERDLRIHRRVA